MIRAAGGHHGAVLACDFHRNLRNRIGQREQDRVGGHLANRILADTAGRDADEHVSVDKRIVDRAGDAAWVGHAGDPLLDVAQRLAVRMDDAARIDDNDVGHASGQQHLRRSDTSGTGAGDDHAEILEAAAGQLAGVD